MSTRLAYATFGVSETCYQHECKHSSKYVQIADWLARLTRKQRNWRGGLCYLFLRNVKGFAWNTGPRSSL